MALVTYRVLAVDPGESWCGLAVFELDPLSTGPFQHPGFYVDQSKKGKIRIVEAVTLEPKALYHRLETELGSGLVSHVVLERYSLYPWLAKEQGYSELETAQCVGVVTYIADRHSVPLTKQDAKGNLKEGRAIAARSGFKMVDRALGSGKFRYRGPDFALPGKPHRRDACAHGVVWSATNPASPLVRARLSH